MSKYHEGKLTGHFGCDKTLTLVQDKFFYPTLRRFVIKFIKKLLAQNSFDVTDDRKVGKPLNEEIKEGLATSQQSCLKEIY